MLPNTETPCKTGRPTPLLPLLHRFDYHYYSNDNTAPYLFNPTDCSQIWAPSRKPFSCSHAEAGTGASWSGTLCFR